MNQIVDDYVHGDRWFVGSVTEQLDRLSWRLAGLGARLGRSVESILVDLGAGRSAARWQRNVADLVQQLAKTVVGAEQPDDGHEDLVERGLSVVAEMDRLPGSLLRQVVRSPSCFRSFDLQPEDLEHLVAAFVDRYPDRSQPLRVAGIRTSGSYLAPLYCALLRASGFQNVTVVTLRPGRPLSRHERAMLPTKGRGELVLLADDPPMAGRSVAKVAEYFERLGLATTSIVLLLPIFGAASELPGVLHKYPSVLLPDRRWVIHQKLSSSAVRAGLAELMAPGIEIRALRVLPLPERGPRRAHARMRGCADLVEVSSGNRWQQEIFVKGVGLGYFGEHSIAVGAALRGLVPEIYGVRDGLLYRAWLPEEARARPEEHPSTFEGITREVVDYVTTRNRTLGLRDDVTMALFGRDPAWELASTLLSHVFGRGWRAARVLLVDRAVRSLLAVERPSIVDGSMAPSNWFQAGTTHQSLLKVDFEERAFSNLDVACSDPIFDLAGFAAGFEDRDNRARIRRIYEESTGGSIPAERWFLYQAVHAIDAERTHLLTPSEAKRALSRQVQRYLGEIFFDDLPVGESGPICAIDLDGVLEVDWLGFPVLTPTGALALRSLRQHGHQLVLATGRSLDDVRDRCQAYGLAGGVAEYGTVVYNHRVRRSRGLVPASAAVPLEAIRSALKEIDDAYVDVDYSHIVRAYRRDPGGARRSLHAESIAAALKASESPDQVRVVHGERQTDFTVSYLDKGTALVHLLKDLNTAAPSSVCLPLAFAIGDTREDLPMLRLAAERYAPANAEPVLGQAGVTVVGGRCQLGLALAVTRFLGHRPGSCPRCRPPRISGDTRKLLAILATQDCKSRADMIWHAAQLARA